jgi:hypothetical protein
VLLDSFFIKAHSSNPALNALNQMQRLEVHLTRISSNEKTGPIPVSTSTATNCPPSCPFNRAGKGDYADAGGCYAESGPLALHWRKITQGLRGLVWSAFCDEISRLPKGQLWRHNQAGDLAGDGEYVDAHKLAELTQANKGRRGFTYTHKHTTDENVEAIRCANAHGFTVNLSANNLAHADKLADLKAGPVVCVLPSNQTKNTTTPAGRKVVICPATYREHTTCATCGLCQKQREAIVGFPAHGTTKRKANAVALAA